MELAIAISFLPPHCPSLFLFWSRAAHDDTPHQGPAHQGGSQQQKKAYWTSSPLGPKRTNYSFASSTNTH